MKRILLTIEYDGSGYFGWQKQPNKPTIQGEIEKALEILLQHPCEIFGSGRTDAGVHAMGQRAHFDMDINIPVFKLADVLNNLLPQDISIVKAEQVPLDFHARFFVKRKIYQYKVYIGKKKAPFRANFEAWIKDNLDIDKMKEAAQLLIGRHNFEGFCSAATAVKDFEREIYKIDIEKKANFVTFTFEGNGFLYNMVRILVGTLIDIGRGRLKKENIQKALKTGDRTLVGVTMPPNGLYLKSVVYE